MSEIWRKISVPALSITLFLMISMGLGAQSSRHSAIIDRGQYLAMVSGCVQCHTPIGYNENTNSYSPDLKYFMAGAPEGSTPPMSGLKSIDFVTSPEGATTGSFGTTFAANLTPDKETGIGNWTFEDFKKVMQMKRYKSQWSHRGDGRAIMPPMSWQLYSPFTDKDLRALYAYLMSLTPIRNRVPEYIRPAGR